LIECIDINLLDICEKKVIAEAKVRELTKLADSRLQKVKDLEHINFRLTKQNSEFQARFDQVDKQLESSKAEVARLMDTLYGIDKAKEYAKLDSETLKTKPIRGYHAAPTREVLKGLYNGTRVSSVTFYFLDYKLQERESE